MGMGQTHHSICSCVVHFRESFRYSIRMSERYTDHALDWHARPYVDERSISAFPTLPPQHYREGTSILVVLLQQRSFVLSTQCESRRTNPASVHTHTAHSHAMSRPKRSSSTTDDHHNHKDDTSTAPMITENDEKKKNDTHEAVTKTDFQEPDHYNNDKENTAVENRLLRRHSQPHESSSCCGIIKSIYCENFMCHVKLRVDLNRNVTFIHGQNGSGTYVSCVCVCEAVLCHENDSCISRIDRLHIYISPVSLTLF